MTTEKGKASVQREVDWGRDLLFFEAEGVGSRINMPLDVPEKGRYEIVARIAQAPDYGDYTRCWTENQPIWIAVKPSTSEIPLPGPEVLHNHQPEILCRQRSNSGECIA